MPNLKLFAILFFALSLSLLAQTPTKEGTANITGRVLLNGEPAAGVSVGLQPQQQASGPFVPDRSKYLRAQSDSEGRFQFTRLNAGQYRILALAPGLLSAGDSQFTPGKVLNLADGETIERIELALKRGAVITGRLTDATGNPLVEKEIRLMKQDARGTFARYSVGGSWEMLRTDDRGIYRIHCLPAGKYKVSSGNLANEAAMTGPARIVYPLTFHPDTTDEARAKIIELSEGSEAAEVDIKLGEAQKTFDVAGRVTESATGKPVAGIRIGYGLMDASGNMTNWGSGMAMTDAQGEYVLQGVMPGKYAAFADSRTNPQSEFYSDPAPFEINSDDVSGVEIRAHRGGSISGFAVIEGSSDPAIIGQLSKINLNLTPRSRDTANGGRSARPGANGAFRFTAVKPGKMDIRAFSPSGGLKLLRVEHNGAPVTDGLELLAGEQLTNVRVIFGHGTATVRGQVKFVGGVLPEGVNLTLIAKRSGAGTGGEFANAVDARNQFVLQNLVAGEYELILFGYSANRTPEMVKLFESIAKASHRVTVSSGETQTEFVVDLSQKENDK